MAITKQELHLLVDELEDDAVPLAEAFLVFLRDRGKTTRRRRADDLLDRARGREWVDTERQGIARRRRDRSSPVSDPDQGGTA